MRIFNQEQIGLRLSTFIFVTIIILISLVEADAQLWDDSYVLNFNYEPTSPIGPDNWGNVQGFGEWATKPQLAVTRNACAISAGRPSPVPVFPNTRCFDTHEMLMRQMADSDCTRDDLSFEITPYSLKAYYPLTDATCVRPSLQIGGRFDTWTMAWMELHARSEHVVGGRRYDAELQMVHTGNGNARQEVLIVSVLIDASSLEDNLEFQWMLGKWTEVANAENEACDGRRRDKQQQNQDQQPKRRKNLRRQLSDYEPQEQIPIVIMPRETKNNVTAFEADTDDNPSSSSSRNLQIFSPCNPDRFGNGCEPLGPRKRMYPYSLWPSIWYYSYFGSMTAPPCSNIVSWRVLDEPMRISKRQYRQLAALLTASRNDNCEADTATSNRGENFRPLQPYNPFDQFVAHCTINEFSYFVLPPEEQ